MSGKTLTTTVSINGDVSASVQKAFTETSNKLSELQKAALQTAGATDKLSAVIDQQSEELENAKKAYSDYILSGEKSRKKAKELESNIKKLTKELDENEENLKKAKESAEKLSNGYKKTKISADELKDGIQKAGDAAKKGLAVVGTAIAGAATAILALGASTQEYRNQQAQLETAFEQAGGTAEQAEEVYNDLYRVLGDGGKATEAAQQLAKLSTNEEVLTSMTGALKGVYATFGDTLPVEALAEAVNETSKTGQVTGALADALNWAAKEGETFGVSLKENIEFTKKTEKELKRLTDTQREEYENKLAQWEATEAYNKAVMEASTAEDFFNIALSNCTDEQERQYLIQEALIDKYWDAGEAFEENNAAILAQNEANAKLEASMAKVGEAVAPINTALTQLGSEILAQLTPYIQEFAANHLPSIVSALSNVGTAIGEVINWIAEHWQLVSTLAGIILGIAAAIAVVSTVMTVVNAVMYASPVTWIVMGIVAAIAALVAIIVTCVKYWDNIRAAAGAAVDWIREKWGAISGWLKTNVIQPIANFFSGLWSGITTGVSNFVNGVKEFFVNGFRALVGIVKAPINGIISLVNGAIDAINSIGFNIPDWVPVLGGKKFSINIPKIPMLATGGFTDGISIAGEKAMEAVISFDPAYRSQNLAYWAEAGRLLGADYSDFALSGNSSGVSIDFGGISFAPNITITGNASKASIMEAIEEEYPEFLDMIEEYLVERGALVYG